MFHFFGGTHMIMSPATANDQYWPCGGVLHGSHFPVWCRLMGTTHKRLILCICPGENMFFPAHASANALMRKIQFQRLFPIAQTSLCTIALTACTLFLTSSCPSSMKITRHVSLVDCGVEFAASCKLPKRTLDTKLTQQI
jgi:hypothetical protein